MSFALALAIAASWWGSHGVTAPCHPQPQLTTQKQFNAFGQPEAYSLSWPYTAGGGCVIVESPAMRIERKTYPPQYCGAIVHELGNIAGIPETNNDTGRSLVTDKFFAIIYDCYHAKKWRKQHWGY